MIKKKSTLWYQMRVFMWAAVFRSDFKYCYLKLPMSVTCDSDYYDLSHNIVIRISFRRRIAFYIPYDVYFAFEGDKHDSFDDDIPF